LNPRSGGEINALPETSPGPIVAQRPRLGIIGAAPAGLIANLRRRHLLLAAIIAGLSTLSFAAFYLAANALLPSPPEGWRWPLCIWDCGWYHSIVERGYDRMPDPRNMSANFGFFPAFPIGVSLLMKVTGLSFVAGGLTLNALLSWLFCWIALKYKSELNLKDEAETTVFLTAFLLSPWSLYNHIPYTEMLFNVAALGAFVFWSRGNYIAAAVFGVVLTATRPTGILMPLVLSIELCYRERHRFIDLVRRPDGRLRALAVMPMGLAAFIVFLYFRVGDPLAYSHIQEFGWGWSPGNPIAVLLAAGVVGPSSQYGAAAFLLASAALLTGVLLRRIPNSLAAFAWLTPCVALTGLILSQPRYALALFPLYLVVPAAPRIVRFVLIAMLALGQAVFVYYWLQKPAALI
jgi:hypothetical protein